MKRNKIISIIEYSTRNKMLAGILAVSLIGAGGVFLSSNASISNNTMGINKTVLAGTVNNSGNKACVINGNDSLVLYTSASNSNIQSYISVGEMLTINSYSNGYYNVTVQETGATGYISSSDMQKIVSGVEDNLTSLSGTAYTTNVSTMVNLREEATMNSTTFAKLKNNTSITLLGKQGDWYKVSYNGTTGYIYGEYIAIANSNTNSSAINNTSSSSNNKSKIIGTTSSNSKNSSIKVTSSHSKANKNKETVKNTQSNSTAGYVYEPIGDGLVGVYQGASDQTALETTLKSGAEVTVLGETNNCYKIEYGNNEIGYIGKQFISFNKPTVKNTQSTSKTESSSNNGTPTYKTSKIAYIYGGTNGTNGSVAVYKTSKAETVETTLKGGTEVRVLYLTDGLSEIEYGNNQIGYISAGYLTSVNPKNSSNNSSTAQIKWVLGNSEFNNPNTVVIENTTGKAIPNNELATYMRDWILNAQYNYSEFADCNGTIWASQWLNTISNSQLVSYFESANGNEALNENITADQLNKATELLSDTLVKDDYTPFTTEQATTYIKEMLAQSYPNQVITKVVLHSGLYYIYTKQGGDSNPWWYVNASTGYATGA